MLDNKQLTLNEKNEKNEKNNPKNWCFKRIAFNIGN